MSAVSTPSLSPCDSLEGPTIRKQFKLPKELDILPPRPVLFPWLPSFDDCCGSFKRKRRPSTQKFSFDLNDHIISTDGKTFGTKKVASDAGTPVTLPLSPNNEDEDDAIPDMSRVDPDESARHYQKQQQRQQQQQQNPQLHSLADVIAEILKVIFFMIHMRNRLLRQTSEEERRKAAYAASMAKSKQNSSTNSLVDSV